MLMSGLHKVSHFKMRYLHTMLFLDADADASPNSPSPLTDGKLHPFFHRNRLDQLHRHLDVVSRHHHLHSLGQLDGSRDVGRANVELRPIAVEERRVPASLFLG